MIPQPFTDFWQAFADTFDAEPEDLDKLRELYEREQIATAQSEAAYQANLDAYRGKQ